MRLNKNILSEAVKKSIQDVILEAIADETTYGQMGPISGLIPAKDFVDIPEEYLEIIDSGDKRLSPRWLGNYFGKTRTYTAYLQYKKAIESKKEELGRTAVNFFTFLSRLRHGFKGTPMSIFDSNGSYMIGIEKNGVFLCVYMAPKSRLSMYGMIKELLQYNNVVFAVTDDLGDMLTKLRVPKYGEKVTARFRGKTCNKDIFGSTYEAAEKGAELVGMTAKISSYKDQLNDVLKNPEIADLVKKNPSLVSQVMSNPNMLQHFLSIIGNKN